MTTLDGAVDLARDRELVERCQAGNEGAFAELYDRYHRRLLRFCLRRVHSQDDAEEAVQEAFTRAWRALPKFGGDRRFYPWLTVIAANVCTDMLRRRARVVPMDEMPLQAVELDGDDVDAKLLLQVDVAMATQAFAHLSDRHQRVLRLRENTEWSAQRIAEAEGVAVPAVDTLLWRARQAFRREFAVLSDAGGLAGLLGIGFAALRRGVARAWLRVAAIAPAPLRGPGAIAATVALTGAAIAGGSVAIAGSGPHTSTHGASPAAEITSTRSTSAPGGAARSLTGSSGTAAASTGGGTAGRAPRHREHGGSGSAPSSTGLSTITGVAQGTKGAASGATGGGATPLSTLFSDIGGIGGALATAPSGTRTRTTAAGTLSGTVAGTVGGVVTGVSGTLTSLGTGTSGTGTSGTGTSGTGTPTSGTLGTVVQTLTTTTTLPLSVPPLTGGGTTTSTGTSSTGALLGGL